jgi:hypothetical protein
MAQRQGKEVGSVINVRTALLSFFWDELSELLLQRLNYLIHYRAYYLLMTTIKGRAIMTPCLLLSPTNKNFLKE